MWPWRTTGTTTTTTTTTLIYPIFTGVSGFVGYGSGSTKLLNMDSIWIRIHNTDMNTVLKSIISNFFGDDLFLLCQIDTGVKPREEESSSSSPLVQRVIVKVSMQQQWGHA